MKNSELWESYEFYTGELTKFSRQLAFAAAAICWFFKSEDVTFPRSITVSLFFVVLFFILDILQYFISAHLLRWWTRREEKAMWAAHKTLDGDYEKPWWIDKPAFILFNLKEVALFVAFVSIGVEFVSRI